MSRGPALAESGSVESGVIGLSAPGRQLVEREDLYRAEQRLIDNQTGRSMTYTSEEMERELGSED